jgi:hypothetical protein
MITQVALVSQSKSVHAKDVSLVSAALQKQATRDFGPIWNVQATVDAFDTLADVPLGYWPMVIRDDVRKKQQAEGIHLDKDGQPFALIQASDSWSVTASHECMEMLADPFGERLVAGQAPKEAKNQKRVEFLVEVCDPSEAEDFDYTINDVAVSDFYTPSFFDPVAAAGVRYSFTGAITKPRTILKGGYLSWHNPPNDHWYQITWFSGSKPVLRDLGVFSASTKSTREIVDSMTVTPRMKKKVTVPKPSLARSAGTATSAPARAESLQAQINRLVQ